MASICIAGDTETKQNLSFRSICPIFGQYSRFRRKALPNAQPKTLLSIRFGAHYLQMRMRQGSGMLLLRPKQIAARLSQTLWAVPFLKL